MKRAFGLLVALSVGGGLTTLAGPVSGRGLSAQSTYPMARHGGGYMRNYYLPPAPSSSPWAPAWSPDGSEIAFSMAGSIWSLDPVTGTAVERTVPGPGVYHSSPAYSPDGRYLIYTADHDGERIRLGVLERATGRTWSLTDDEHVHLDPAFSPDGARLAYVVTRPSGYFNVVVRPFEDGVLIGEEVPVTRDHDYPRDRLYFGPHDMHTQPSWFPDGSELLLVSNRNVALGSGNVVRVPVRRDGIDAAETVLAEQSLYRTRPDVSPDGTRFVYSSTAGAADQFNNLYLQPTDGGEPYKLTFFEHDAFHPRWSPDGEWIVFVSNEGGVPGLELLEVHGGARTPLEIRERRWARPTGTLRVRITDEDGTPLPARIHLEASDGRFYAPPDRLARVGGAGDHLFHATDAFEVTLPVGRAALTVIHGFEFMPVMDSVEILEGQVLERAVSLTRMVDLAAGGCFSGSTHVHLNYGGNLHNTLQRLSTASRAEGQHVLTVQIANKDNRVLDHQFFVPGGGPHPTSAPDHLVVVGQEYRPPFYGHVFMLGLRDHLISPFTTGYEGTAIESLYPSNTDMLRRAIDQGATVGYVHPFLGDEDPLAGTLGGAKGFMVDAALGTTHALEWSQPGRAGFFPLYAAWNNGLAVAAVGGEDAITDLHRWRVVGSMRTVACPSDGALELSGWFGAVREGRSYVTSGPLLTFSVEGREPGGRVELAGPDEVRVQGRVRSIVPVKRLELVQDGKVIHTHEVQGPSSRSVELDLRVPFERSGWIHMRVEGDPADRYPIDVGYAQAFTNPVWVTVAGAPVRNVEAAEYGMRWIERLRELADAWPGWRTDQEREHVFAQFEEAAAVYERLRAEAGGEG